MNPALWGGLCALSLGGADFIARFTSRGIGYASALLGMLCTGALVITVWVLVSGAPLRWDASGLWALALNGVATTAMTLLLYLGLARGPISIVAPIVASHPLLVVAFAVLMGVRPGAIQWLAMAATVLGVVFVARSTAHFEGSGGHDRRELRITVIIAFASSLAYAVLVIAAQRAVPIYGELQTLWLGRLFSLAALLLFFVARRERPRMTVRWLPLVIIQGLLDAAGYFFLFAGSDGEGAEIAAVTASTFGVVTVLLARFVLREAVSSMQWAGIALVAMGVGVLLLAD